MNWSNEWGKPKILKDTIPEYNEWIKDGAIIKGDNQATVVTEGASLELPKGFEVKPDWVIDAVNYSIVQAPIKFIIPIKDEGRIEINAVIVGDLAVHTCIQDYDQWQVTHVPTFTKFSAVPEGLHTKKDLIKWCKKVQEQLPEDWKLLATLTADNYKMDHWHVVAAKDRVWALCRGTKV